MDGFVPPANRPDAISAAEDLIRKNLAWLSDRLRPRYGDQAEDLAQEVLLRAAVQDVPSKIRYPKAFLLRAATNLATDKARREQRERKAIADSLIFQPAPSDGSPEEMITLKKNVLALPSELRDALVLTKIKGLSYEDVAVLKGWKVRTVKDRVRQALLLIETMRG